MNIFSGGRYVVVALAAIGVLVGCGVGKDDQVDVQSSTDPSDEPPYLDYTFRWSGSEADLSSPDGTFVRAFFESYYRGVYGGYGVAYPGFADANRGGVVEVGTLAPPLDVGPYRTRFFAIGAIISTGADTSRALVCDWAGSGGRGGAYVQLDYKKTGAAPLAPQSGRARKPGVNVFGDWFAISETRVDSDPAAQKVCDPTKPANPVAPNANPLPPVPGWPE